MEVNTSFISVVYRLIRFFYDNDLIINTMKLFTVIFKCNGDIVNLYIFD